MEEFDGMLWVDDRIEDMGEFVAALEKAGLKIKTASSTKEAKKIAKSVRFNTILIDLKMPYPDGIEAIRAINKIQPEARIGVLSSYLYLTDYQNALLNLDFEVHLIDKDIPAISSPEFEKRFINPVRDFAMQKAIKTISDQVNNIKELSQRQNVDPFDIPLGEFMSKSIAEKDILVDLAKEMAANTIEKAFLNGIIWVFLCGSSKKIIAQARTFDEIWSEEQIMEFARKQNRPPYQYLAPIDVEDMSWNKCGKKSNLDNYPTISLAFNDQTIDVHFDTGSPTCFFSYEDLLELQGINPTTIWGTSHRGTQSYRFTILNIDGYLRDQRNGEQVAIKIFGQAVRDWKEAPFARYCDEECIIKDRQITKNGKLLCPKRRALIGRNILIDNGLSLILDGKAKQTAIEKE
jgi:CheY-like chemotaxis protein